VIDFARYLAAKKSVDDRAINRFVWEQLKAALFAQPSDQPLQVLELGCGIGTMVARLLEWDLAANVCYLGIDTLAENIVAAEKYLQKWAQENGYHMQLESQVILLSKRDVSWQVRFQHADAISYRAQSGFYDLLIANAFLDLVDVPSAMPRFASWLKPDGFFYFTINFDGETIFEPVSDPKLEEKIIMLYHQSMDERTLAGQPSGDSHTGRHLFSHLTNMGVQILAAGASDWIVFSHPNGYSADEAYFLRCILNFFESTLQNHPELTKNELDGWLERRRAQIERVELVYIAHQLDFLGRFWHSGGIASAISR